MRYNLSENLSLFISKYYVVILVTAILIGLISLYLLIPVYGMSPVWSVPYFSGAANSQIGGEWLFAPAEVLNYKALRGWEIYQYRFEAYPASELTSYSANTTAYLYIVMLAQTIFPFIGQIGAVVLLQLLVHIAIVAIVWTKISKAPFKLLFVLLYAVNPLILYLTLMPFYYFWSVLGSAGAMFILLNPRADMIRLLGYLCMIIIGFFTRATVFPLVIFVFFVLLYHRQYISAAVAILFVIGSVSFYNTFLNKTKGYGPWHTAFIGVGAYPNPYPHLYDLSDDRGTDRYREITGVKLSTSIDGNFYEDDIKSHYSEIMQSEYMEIATENPFLIMRNVILNVLQSYSVGHVPNKPLIINLLISLTGLGVLMFLFISKAYSYILLIFFSSIGVAILYPPIPPYHFDTYLLLVFSIIAALQQMTFTPKKIMI